MKKIKERIIKSYDETRYLKLLYNGKKWYQNPQFYYLCLFIFLSIPIFLQDNIWHRYIFILVWFILFLGGFFAIINPYMKKIAKKNLNITASKGKFSHWANTEFREKQLDKFYFSLKEKEVLNENDRDIELLELYEKMFLEEAEQIKSKEKIVLGVGILLLFIIPVWSSIIPILLSEKEDFMESLKFILSLLFLIYAFIYFLNLIKFWLDEFSNKLYWKYIDIKNNLRDIRLYIELKKRK